MRRFPVSRLARQILFSLSVVVALAASARAEPTPTPDLEAGFRQPPVETRPRTLWMWMNGNVSADGITRDLEAMQRVGLGGALIFNVGEYIPKGAVDYGSPAWLDLVVHAARESDRLGLKLAMHNAPGWSSSGGPWIDPEHAMQQLVWSETRINGGRALELSLAQPPTKLAHYRDIAVLAFPSLPGEETSFADAVSSLRVGATSTAAANATDAKSVLTDNNPATRVTLTPQEPLLLEFAAPFEARAITVCYASGGASTTYTLEASDDGAAFRPVAKLVPPNPRAIEDAPIAETFDPVSARFFRLTPSRKRDIMEVELHRAPRIASWHTKAAYTHRPSRQDALPPEPAARFIVDPARIVDLTTRLDAGGRLAWDAPAGAWTIVRFGHTASGRENIAAPDAGIGLECDKLSAAGADQHFERSLGPLLARLGPLAGKTFTGLEVDSYEVGMQNWTSSLPAEFAARNGYDITPHLLEMTGRFVGSAASSDRFLWDLRRTLGDMVEENYYTRLRTHCARHGLELLIEPYGAGPGPYDEIDAAGRADVPLGEFWARFPWDDTPSIRLAASAAHTHGRAIVAAESFTAMEEQSRFMEFPYALKSAGDLAFSLGLNRMYFHRYAHQPHPTAAPGMTMGPWGFHFDRNVTWFDQSGPWLTYLARSQFLLQQGKFVADVLHFTGEGSPQMSKRATPELPFGYTFDAASADVLYDRVSVRDGRIVLPDGVSYRLLALPKEMKAATPKLLRRLHELVTQGATLVVGDQPSFSPSLRDQPAADADVRKLVDDLWHDRVRPGRVIAGRTLAEALSDLNVSPDFGYTSRAADAALVWLHRRVGDADVYFVANRQRRAEEVVCDFRVAGRRPEIWHAETGARTDAALYSIQDGRTRVPLLLQPSEAVFVVFRAPADPAAPAWIAKNGERLIDSTTPTTPTNAAEHTRAPAGDFTLEVWIKPETDLMYWPREALDAPFSELGKSWVIPPADLRAEFGETSAGLGLTAGRNGVILVERSGDRVVPVLVAQAPVSGWTHLAVNYQSGKPSLYLNGRHVRDGLVSGKQVHPSLHAAPPRNRVTCYFEGEHTPPRVSAHRLADDDIARNAAATPPPTAQPAGLEFSSRRPDGALASLAWGAGQYTLSDDRSLHVDHLPAPLAITGPWQISFPPKLGAPTEITLSALRSLRLHDDPGVKHFAGVATYRTRFDLPADAFASNRRLFLDLGRVEVLADVRLNGQSLGTLWKTPFRIDATDALRAGANELEIRVTTLWPNRLIGDEQLPPDNDYNTRTRAISRIPDWFERGAARPASERIAFATWRFFGKDDPLIEAGLLGPVRLFTAQRGVFSANAKASAK